MLRHRGLLLAFTTLLTIAALGRVYSGGDAKTKLDRQGDPLPDGAKARMGTTRWRHAETVTFVAFPSETTVLTASLDNTIRIWERSSGKELHRIDLGGAQPKQPGRPVAIGMGGFGRFGGSQVSLSGDSKTLASVSGNTIQLWDVATAKELRKLNMPANGVADMLLSPDGKSIALVGADRNIRILKTENGDEICQITSMPQKGPIRFIVGGGLQDVSGLAFSPDGKTLASVLVEFGQQKTTTYLRLSNTADGKEIRKTEMADGVSSIVFAPDGKTLAFGSNTNIILTNAETGKEIRTLKNGAGTVASLVFSPDGKVIAAKGRDNKVRLWDATNGKDLHEVGTATPLQAGGNAIFFAGINGVGETRDLSFSRDSKTIGVGGTQAPRFYNVGTGKEQAPAGGGHKSGVSSLLITPDGKTLLSAGNDHVIRRWNAATGEEIGQISEPDGTLAVAFSPDARTIALANSDGTIRLLSAESGKELHKVKGHQNGIAGLVFSADSKLLASRGSFDNKISIIDVAAGSERQSIAINPDAPPMAGGGFGRVGTAPGMGLTFSPDGAHVATCLTNGVRQAVNVMGKIQFMEPTGSIRVWDVATGKSMREIKLPAHRGIASIAYSPDGRLIASENTDRTVSIWEISSGRERATMGQPDIVAMQPGGAGLGGGFIVVGGRRSFTNPQAPTSIAFSPNGEHIVTRSGNDVKVWDTSLAKEVGQFKGHSGPVGPVVFAPDGKSAASGSADTTILVWDLARIKREPLSAIALQPEQIKSLWDDLGGSDAIKAGQGIRTLAAGVKDAVPFLGQQIKPAIPVDAKKIDQWIIDLDSNNFQRRTKAAVELEKIGELARPALKKVLDSEPTPEMRRRIEPMLEKLVTGTLTTEQVRVARAVEALEKSGSTEARQLLQTLAQGAHGAFTTREAQDALVRMKTRP